MLLRKLIPEYQMNLDENFDSDLEMLFSSLNGRNEASRKMVDFSEIRAPEMALNWTPEIKAFIALADVCITNCALLEQVPKLGEYEDLRETRSHSRFDLASRVVFRAHRPLIIMVTLCVQLYLPSYRSACSARFAITRSSPLSLLSTMAPPAMHKKGERIVITAHMPS